MQVQQLQNLEPVLTKAIQSGETKIVGTVYDLLSGKVEFLDSNFLKHVSTNP
jgi:carbonic anhydrase